MKRALCNYQYDEFKKESAQKVKQLTNEMETKNNELSESTQTLNQSNTNLVNSRLQNKALIKVTFFLVNLSMSFIPAALPTTISFSALF